MNRSVVVSFLAVLVFLVMIVVGYVSRGSLEQWGILDPAAPPATAGWCCVTAGSECVGMNSSETCINDSAGRVFDTHKDICDLSCVSSQ